MTARSIRQQGELRRYRAMLARYGFARMANPNDYQQIWTRGRDVPGDGVVVDQIVLTLLARGRHLVEAELTVGDHCCSYFYESHLLAACLVRVRPPTERRF